MLNENDVVAAVCEYLKSQGYAILQQCATTEQGIDIIAQHPTKRGRLLIEAKGGTSAREGSARYAKGFNPSQVFDRVAKGFYTTACMHAEHAAAGDEAAMAYPDTPAFRSYLARVKAVTDAVGIQILLVKPDRSIEVFSDAA